MTMGPVQLLVVGFDDPQFNGQILAELDRLRESDVVRLVDLLVVRKDDEGNVERLQRTDLTPAEAEQPGATSSARPTSGTSTTRSPTAPPRPWPSSSTAGPRDCATPSATPAASIW